jgi:hypothetical protein
MTPPFFLYPGNRTIQVNIVTPHFRGEVFLLWPGTFVFPAVTEFITVPFTAYGAG